MDYGIAWMETEPNGITQWKRTWLIMYGIGAKWKRTWHIMDGNGAKWHHIMESDMEYYEWKRSQSCIFSHRIFQFTTFIRYGFAVCILRKDYVIAWMETEPNGIT